MNVDHGPWNAGKSCKERETCYEKKILSELAHFDSPFFFRLKLGFVSGHRERRTSAPILAREGDFGERPLSISG
jgi:hypothetical protein